MWEYNKLEEKWEIKKDFLDIDNFNFLKQEQENVRFYANCFSGATYLPMNNEDNIYDVLSQRKFKTWYIDPNLSDYVSTLIPPNYPSPINKETAYDYYTKTLAEYNLTLKNLFTPEKIINDSFNNFIYVDVASTKEFDDLNDDFKDIRIDGVRLKNGHRVLIKNQVKKVVLPIDVNPGDFFEGNYKIIETIGLNTTYEYYDDTNGIYLYNNGNLIKENDLDDYNKSVRYSVSVKLGNENKNKQYHLSRLLNGLYPTTKFNEPIEFVEKKNRILRNRLDYNNILDLNYYDVLKHSVQAYDFENINYTIPSRILSVGEFGVIINNQNDKSNIIRNKYKVDLKSITQTEFYYWVVGDKGTLLRIRKHDFDIEKIKLKDGDNKINSNLKSISFVDDLRGVIVGEFNTILLTNDGGITWDKFFVKAFNSFNYNKVIYYNLNKIFVGGNNGVFLEIKKSSNEWVAYKRRISKFIDDDDEFLLVDNINDMLYTNINWDIEILNEENNTDDKNILCLVTDDSNIIVYDIDDSIPLDNDFIYLDFLNENYGDITNIIRKDNTDMFYFIGFTQDVNSSGIFEFNLNNFEYIIQNSKHYNITTSNTPANLFIDLYPNKLFDFDSQDFIICGNNSLLKKSQYSVNFQDLDDEFGEKLKSKLLFLDYDIGSKLNFFTDDGQYRLPNSIDIDFADFEDSYIEFKSFQGESNWFDYWKDTNSTFEYFSDNPMTDSSKIEISSKFEFKSNSSIKIGFGLHSNVNSGVYLGVNQRTVLTPRTNITNNLDDIIKLAPNINIQNHSRFNKTSVNSNTLEIETNDIDENYNMFLYDYLMIIRYTNEDIPKKGDVLRIETDFLKENFVVNKIVDADDKGTLVYLYTNFNDSIINKLKNVEQFDLINLNSYDNIGSLIDNFNKHPLSNGYEMIRTEQENTITQRIDLITINPLFNNITSYYNLSTDIIYNNIVEKLTYKSNFLKFGYTPTYNLLDYLESINDNNTVNPIFFENKEYYSMPIYNGLPVDENDGDSVYIDYNIKNNNKLTFGKNLEFEWTSIFINTFIDIKVYENTDSSITTQLLVIDKYYDEINDTYVIEFHKKINYPNINQVNPLTEIDIISRRTLGLISEDLNLLNNIQRSYFQREYESGTFDSGQIWQVSFETLDKKLNFKVNTDSYAKILLSDFDTNNTITGIIYTDFKNEFALNITKLEESFEIPIINTSNFNGDLLISCSEKHNLSDNEGVLLNFNGGIGSSEQLNPQYFGYRVVTVVNEFDFYVDINYGLSPTVGNDTGIVSFIKKDSFLNYQPTDLIDVGLDKVGKKSIILEPENVILDKNLYFLDNVNFNNFRFRLIDGLDIQTLADNYSWIYESEITDAVIGLDVNGLVWYKGNWDCGRWFGGTWISGNWLSGDWYGGIWKSMEIKDNFIDVEVNKSSINNENSSTWFGGRWFDGEWANGTWKSGRWYGGIWKNGIWDDGVWNKGEWLNGKFNSGIWIDGAWYNGKFNTSSGPAFWLDGNWNGGDFENGIWFNGVFDSKNNIESRFGIKSYNSRNAIWKGGKFLNGSFHSRLNIDNDGNYDVSEIHKYSIWETGTWFNGNFYGGVAFNIDFKSGIWHGGIVEDINIIDISVEENYITIPKEFNYNIGDKITVIGKKIKENTNFNGSFGNQSVSSQNIILGSNDTPIVYTVIDSIVDGSNTNIFLDVDLDENIDVENYNYKSVTRFRNGEWKSGLWFNGVFEDGFWRGGLWYDGVFSAKWM